MTVRRLLALVGATSVLWTVAGATAAQGQATASIRSVTDAAGRLQLVVSGSDLGGARLDPASVSVTIDGMPAPASAQNVSATTIDLNRQVVLLVDTSGSMAGAGIAAAKQAATAYLRAAPRDVAIGLISFADTARVLAAPSQDRASVARAVAGLTAKGETAMYDGVQTALHVLGARGLRNVVLLSDGADTVSKTTMAVVLPAVRSSGVRVDGVAFRTNETAGATIQQIAGATGGRVLSATGVSALTDAFRRAAVSLTDQVIVTAEVPEALAGRQATVCVTLSAGAASLADQVIAVLPARPVLAPADAVLPALKQVHVSQLARSHSTLVWGLGGLFLAVVLIGLLATGSGGRRERAGSRQRRLLSLYTLTGKPTPVADNRSVVGDSQIAQSALELAGRFAQRRGLEERLALRLERAAVPLRPNEWLLLSGGLTTLGFFLLLVLSGNGVGGLIGGVAGAVLPGRWLAFKARRRQAAFEDALPDALQLLSGSLSAGFSLPQAIDAVAREGGEPIAGEFGRAVAEARLGILVEESLAGIADRMDSENFRWVTMAVRTQRDVGGNLAEVLSIVSQTMRDRAKLKRQVTALSAEGKLSAYVLLALPLGMAVFLFGFRRSYVAPLYHDAFGIIMLVVSNILLGLGFLWMRAVIKVEV